MQIESRTCQARLGNYAEMQLIFCKDKIHLLQYDYNNDINGFSLRKIIQKGVPRAEPFCGNTEPPLI